MNFVYFFVFFIFLSYNSHVLWFLKCILEIHSVVLIFSVVFLE